uniref:CalG n=1 Tax=uncultured Candidatus Entotheonella sp. TaxID=312019 RepID=A0A068PC20_9BACT|nr:CalG [uncultured Candidatus Entotheonella sp.]
MSREDIDKLINNSLWEELETWMGRLLFAQMRTMGAFENAETHDASWRAAGVLEKYARWWRECGLDILEQNGHLRPMPSGLLAADATAASPAAVWQAWEPRLQAFLQEPEVQAAVQLVDACLRRLPEILRGTVPATEVLFPRSSMSQVEHIYRRNTLADYFNGLVADAVSSHVEQRIAADRGTRIRLIEIGAGTGGTTAVVLPALQSRRDFIETYCYTDISKAFLIHAQTHFLPDYPYLERQLWNVEEPLPDTIPSGFFDIAIATNVLHATRNIRETLRHTKAALKSGGLLILNEGIQKTTLNSLTFGLLDGWWRFEDPNLRIPGSPLLNARNWRRVLAQEGFRNRPLPAKATRGLGQQVFVAESDGIVRRTVALTPPPTIAEAVATPVQPEEANVSVPTPVSVATDAVDVRAFATDTIREALAHSLKIDEAVETDIPFSDYGIDSILGVRFVDQINEGLGLSLNTAILFDYTTVDRLAGYLAEEFSDRIRLPQVTEEQTDAPAAAMAPPTAATIPTPVAAAPVAATMVAPAPTSPVRSAAKPTPAPIPVDEPDGIAVIGIAGQFPGASDTETFWRNLIEGRDGVSQLPEEYLDLDKLVGLDEEGNPYYQSGGFLENRNCFDPLFFSIAPREAESMNPHQRLILQESWKALEDAGYNPRGLDGSEVGIFIGSEPTEYFYESFTGASEAIVASRLSYHLNLRGPALVVNTGCSSSGVAVHLACESLRRHESNLALAGGVSAVMKQSGLNTLAEAGMLSPTGACHTFDASGNGTVLSEGVGVVVLKRLCEAIADEDPIYGVILASGMNQDGTSNGITAPNGLAQEALIRNVYRRSHIDPEQITYVEAHGTGTQLGDPVEGNALVRAFRHFTKRKHYCKVGSAKAHIGHTSAAAGVIGLIKILLSLKHRQQPGLLHFEQLNPQIDFEDSPFLIDHRAAAWEAQPGVPLMAALNSFGHSGTNVHLVVSEARVPAAPAATDNRAHLVAVSAADEDRLNEYVANLLAFIESATATTEKPILAKTARPSEALIRKTLAGIIHVDETEIEVEERFDEYGVGPLHQNVLLEQLGEILDVDLTYLRESSIATLAARLDAAHPQPATGDLVPALHPLRLCDLAYTLQVGREAMSERVIFLVHNLAELQTRLKEYLQSGKTTDCWSGRVTGTRNKMQALSMDEDTREMIARWTAKEKLNKLAELWIEGVKIDWELLRDGYARRISLPSYPFAKEYYDAPGKTSTDNLKRDDSVSVLHPLVHRNTSNFGEQRFTSTFTGDEFFFQDHQVHGRRVLPGVAYLELARVAVALTLDCAAVDPPQVQLKNVVWARPISIENDPLDVHIALTPQEDRNGNEEVHFQIYTEPSGERRVHAEGIAVIATPDAVTLDLAELQRAIQQGELDAETCYDAFRQMGIEYGPGHRGLTGLRFGTFNRNGTSVEPQILAKLQLPAGQHGHDYLLHPGLMDSALQASIGFMLAEDLETDEASMKPSLPFALEELAILRPCPVAPWVWTRPSPGTSFRDRVQKLDIDLFDDQGRVCVRLQRFSSRTLDGDIPSEIGNKARTGLMTLSPVWNVFRPEALPLAPAERVAVIGGEAPLLDQIRSIYPKTQSLSLAGTEAPEALSARLAALGPIDHLVWIAPSAQPDSLADEALITDQEQGVIQVFRLVKALLASGYGEREFAWSLITTQTLAIRQDDIVNPTHAGVHGLAGSLAKEYPHWRIRLLDLEAGRLPSASWLFSLPPHEEGDALVIRGDACFTRALVPVAEPVLDNPTRYRKGGVYVVIGGAGGIGEVWSRYVIEQHGAHVFWLGRRPLDQEIRDRLASFDAKGPVPEYIQADAGDPVALQQALEQIRQRHPRIHGVIHSAIVLLDKSLARMDEPRFRAGLSAKIDVSVHLAQVFQKEDLDFILFFSSLQSFTRGAGQSNYAAGCTFKDAFAHGLATSWPGADKPPLIRIMNWGYWGGVGIVTDEAYRERMAQGGLGSIEPDEGMAALDTLLRGQLEQLILLKTLVPEVVEAMCAPETVTIHPAAIPACIDTFRRHLPPRNDDVEQIHVSMGPDFAEMNTLYVKLLGAVLHSLGLFGNNPPRLPQLYDRWFAESINILKEHDHLSGEAQSGWTVSAELDLDARWREWEHCRPTWIEAENQKAQIILVEVCLRALPDILNGRRQATDVLFPNASMELVEGIHKGNMAADLFNEVLEDTVVAYLEERCKQPGTEIRILEIGAGTGGTTAGLLPRLQPYRDHIREYCFTDISRAFLLHAETNYASQNPFLTTAMFDVSLPLEGQNITPDRYDLVIATNVLHATANIRQTLRNTKATMHRDGLLILNELCSNSLFAHLTFGLLEGWWLYEDDELRIPGCPGLHPETWASVLEDEGFAPVFFPAESMRDLGQQVIVAPSDGIVRQAWLGQEHPIVSVPVSVELETEAGVKTSPDGASLREKSAAYIKRIVASTLRMSSRQLDTAQPLEAYGLDSILVVHLTNAMRKHFDNITSTLFFEVQTIDALVDHLLEYQKDALVKQVGETPKTAAPAPTPVVAAPTKKPVIKARSRLAPAPSAPVVQEAPPVPPGPPGAHGVCDVAIIGLSGRYPKAKNVDEFWQRLKEGTNCIEEIPADRWDWKRYHSDEKGVHGKVYSRWGGFIDEHDRFDPLFFQISPREARLMDPQERIFLETAHACIEDAGYTPATVADERRRVGVYVGVMNSTYAPQPNFATISNRISYVFDFHGPSMSLDTACSSSLTAIHLALESLYAGTSDCALAGGVHLNLHPIHYQGLCEVRMLSSDGRCKSFSEDADGFVPGEGSGVVLLKPLDQAIADGDHIYAVIKGSTINAGGKTNGYTVPNPNAQYRLIADTLERAGVDARTVGYIEAHGTGTSLGDPIEISALNRAFQQSPHHKVGETYCAIGSVKSNLGHCESAAGIAGLTKVLLQMKHAQLVPSLHAQQLNSRIDFEATPFTVQRTLAEWPRPELNLDGVTQQIPRRAGVSSFGAGGANAHLVLEEFVSQKEPASAETERVHLIVLSARKEDRLKEMVGNLHHFLVSASQRSQPLSMASLAFTLQIGREAMDERLALLARTPEELEAKLQRLLEQWAAGEPEEVEDFFRGSVPGGPSGQDDNALSVFAADEELQEAIEKWIQRGKYARLLEVWVKGLSFDWFRLYEDASRPLPKCMSLPTYPFARDRYWMNGGDWVPALEDEGSSMGPRAVNLGVWQQAAPAGHEAEPAAQAATPPTPVVPSPPAPVVVKPADPLPSGKPEGLVLLTSLSDIKPLGPEKVQPATPLVPAAASAPAPARETLQHELTASLADALFMQVDDISLDKPFIEMGLDSIIGVEWIQTINATYELSLPATRLYDSPNIRELADFLHEQLQDGSQPTAVVPPNVEPVAVLAKPRISLTPTDAMTAAPQEPPRPEGEPAVAKPAVAVEQPPFEPQEPEQTLRDRPLEILRVEVRDMLAEALFMQPGEVDIDTPFIAMGLDSIIGVEWMQSINERYGLELQATRIYDFPTICEFAAFLQQVCPLPPADVPIPAVVAITATVPQPETSADSVLEVDAVTPVLAREAPLPVKAKATVSHTEPQPSVSAPPAVARPQGGKRQREASPQEPIAIIGMSGRYPGAADLDQFWQNLTRGVDSVVEVPASRWNVADFYDPDPTKPGGIYCKWLGVLDDVDCFDPLFFMISPAEAEGIDPQHRLFLQEGWRAFEDAGLNRDALGNTRCGVYLGIMSNEYAYLVSKNPDDVSVSGNSFAIAAARIAYALNLKGPAIPIDTACSSSLVATHLACQALANREIDMALVGGVSLYLGPEPYLGMCASGMLSPEGKCKTFDNSADGFVPGEGVGTVVLKRLAEAEADGDRIEAVIIGSGINQDGKTNGITAPSTSSQIALEREVYRRNRIDSQSIGYVETHGTGTKLGDPIELEALATVFNETQPPGDHCAIGSVKTNLGHTSAAAGVASIHKVVLCLRERSLVPSLHFKEANAHLDLENSPFYVNTEFKPWEGGATLRRAAISSFGFSGTNAHVVIEEYPQPAAVPQSDAPALTLVPLSAKDGDRLLEMADRLLHYLQAGSEAVPVQPVRDDRVARRALEERIGAMLSQILHVREQDIDNEQDFIEYGVDPIHQARLCDMVEKAFSVELDGREFMQKDSVTAIVNDLLIDRVAVNAAVSGDEVERARPVRRPRELRLADLAHSLQNGRETMEERVAFIASSPAELIQLLREFIAQNGQPHSGSRIFRGSIRDYREVLAGIGSLEDLNAIVDLRIERRDLARLAGYWTCGVALDWNRLFGGSRPQPLSLPTYPFAKERYWAVADSQPVETQGPVTGVLHPLLHRNTSNLEAQRFTTTLTGREFFLEDHVVRIDGLPAAHILPGVAHLEMAWAAVAHTLDATEPFRLANIVWLRPLIVNDTCDVHIRLFPENTDLASPLGFEIYEEVEGERIIYSQGRVLRDRQPSSSDVKGSNAIDLPALRADLSQRVYSGDECYRAFEAMGISYGPAQRALATVYSDARSVLAELNLPDIIVGSAATYTLHPSLLDVALQASIALFLEDGEGTGEPPRAVGLPFALDEVAMLADTRPAWARIQPAQSDGELQRLDVDLLDEEGRVCIRLKGFTSRTAAKPVAEALVCTRVWQPGETAAGEHAAYTAHLLFVAEPLRLTAHACGWSDNISVHTLASRETAPAQRYRALAGQVFAAVKPLLQDMPGGRVLVQLIFPATEEARLLRGLGALLKTAQLENPGLVGQVIEVAPDEQDLPARLRECSRVPQETEIRYRAGRREATLWEERSDSGSVSCPWQDRGVYLITGGLGGLGLVFARDIAERTEGAVLVLVGRSPLEADRRKQLAAIETLGARTVYRQVDISQAEAVDALVREIQTAFGGLNGILHSAGVHRDNFIINKSEAEFDAVFAPKVAGTVNLDEATRHLELDVFLLFSSSAGAAGSLGQADYAAANGFMDAYAAQRNECLRARGNHASRTLSINWPLWKEGGMQLDPQTEQRLWQETGMAAMETEAGIRALERGLATGQDQVMVLAGDTHRLRRTLAGAAAEPATAPTLVTAVAPANPPSEALPKRALAWFRQLLSSVLKIPVERILGDEPFENYGIDSIIVVKLSTGLEEVFGPISKTIFFEYGNLKEITAYFLENHGEALQRLLVEPPVLKPQKNRLPAQKPKSAPPERLPERLPDIAVIGLSGRYPCSRDLDAFWKNLSEGRDCITEIPEDRWNWRDYYTADREEPGAHYSRWGGFIEDADKFDSLFFNISPNEARFLDPQERLFLEHVWAAMEDAGYRRQDLLAHEQRASQVGVYAGVMYGEYQFYGVEASLHGKRMGFAGTLAGIANRVSYVFNLHGPSMTVETMCSSSLTSLHLACQDLKYGVTDMAVAGGVNLSVHPNKYLMLSSGQFISSHGRCESFGEGGDGYIPGEGVGVAILKRLADAERDHDHIYGVIRGSAINHGGKTNGYSVPNPRAQQMAVTGALDCAGIDPRRISYIEAHGTGTRLGDPIEITGLTWAFREHTPDTQFCRIGSAKSNIGHCEAAAGIAGFTKVLLQLKHGYIVPSLHSQVLNPNIDFATTPFIVNQELCPWERPVVDGETVARTAGISSFGAGGSNAHILVEEYRESVREAPPGPYAIVISAKTEDRLQAIATNLLHFLDKNPSVAMADVAYTLQVGREALTERLAFTVSDCDDMQERLRAFLAGPDAAADGFVRGRVRRDREPPEWSEMGADLFDAIDHRRYAGLLDLWVQGLDVDWNRLWPEQPFRISLPTYPFAGQHYWAERPSVEVKQTVAVNGFHSQPDNDDAFEQFHSALLDRLSSEEIAIDDALQIIRGR